jgi:thiol-disulfide isomerase/thioredoxin
VTGLYVLAGALVLTAVLAVLHRRNEGRLTSRGSGEDLRPLIPASGEKATLLQFSSAFCAPCRATRRTLAEVADAVPGVEHVEVDAEGNLELVRRLNILKTPTTLVLDAEGREVLRASGQPRKAEVLSALGQAVPS